jgi:hypothetical protein
VRRELVVYLASTSSQTLSPPLSCLVQKGEGIVCLGGTSKAYTVAQLVDDGDGSFVIEDAVNTDCCCPTPHQPLFIATNSVLVYSYIFSFSAITRAASWAWRSGTKRWCGTGRASRTRTRRCLRRRQSVRHERQDAGVTVNVWTIFYVGSGLELEHMKKGKIKLPWGDFSPADVLAAGAFTGATGVGGPCLRTAITLSLKS